MSNIPKAASDGSDKMHPDAPSSHSAEWKPPTTADGEIDWLNMEKSLPPRDPELGFYLNHEEKRAAKEREAKTVEDLRRIREAELETAKLNAGVALPPRPQTDQSAIVLEWAVSRSIDTMKLEYLVDPFLPTKCVVGFFGRGSTAKSSFLATMAARISDDCSTLWISVEELKGWIAQRHVQAGGAEGTLAVFSHNVVKRDAQGRVSGSTFDIYTDLNGAILTAAEGARNHYNPPRPLRLVVLDTALGLTTWAKGENANDDGSVKRLLGYLQSLAEQHNVCIAFIGHSNKGKHDYFADTAAGSSAWTNSPRLSFIHASDRRDEFHYVMRVAKSNLSSPFGVAYRTVPVLELHQHEDGHASFLCKVELEPVVWGADASMELFEDATRKPAEDNEGGTAGRQSLVENVLNLLVQTVYATNEPVTRDHIHAQLGREVGRREWRKVDERLTLGQFSFKVAIVSGAQNKLQYQKQA